MIDIRSVGFTTFRATNAKIFFFIIGKKTQGFFIAMITLSKSTGFIKLLISLSITSYTKLQTDFLEPISKVIYVCLNLTEGCVVSLTSFINQPDVIMVRHFNIIITLLASGVF